jgi:formate hydrogenlyase subunit 3/multisubunit Na+/H+ antiporter MnhD subunit
VAALILGLDAITTSTVWTWHSDELLRSVGGLTLRVDPLAAFFLVIVALAGIPASLYGIGYVRTFDDSHGRAMHGLLNSFLAGMYLVVLADNAMTFLLGWELMALSSYLLIVAAPDQEDSAAAATWYVVMTHAGFLALLVAFVLLGQGSLLEFAAMRGTALELPSHSQAAVVVLTVIAFGSKAGLVPFHVWLPRAHPAAPSHVSALMSAAMVKLGVYGAVRVLLDFMPPLPPWWGGAVLVLGVVTALTGVLYSVAETHLKRVLAYSTIENVGLVFVALGFALLMRGYGYGALAAMGLIVALLHTLNHAVFKTLLFLAAGAIVHSTHASSLEALGGLIKRMPHTAVFCLVGVLALAAVPPLNGFTSEWLTFQLLVAGARHTAPSLAIMLPLALAAVALVAGLAAVSAVRLFGIAFLALPRSANARDAREAPAAMRWAMCMPALMCVVLGLAPTTALTRLTAVTSDLGLPMGQLDAGFALALPLVGSRLSPSGLALLVIATAVAAALASRVARRWPTRIDSAWNCGRMAQSSRTEYTAAAFAEPLKRVFTGFYRPTQEVTIDVHPVSPYFVRAITLRSDFAPWIEQTIYGPVIRAAQRLSARTAGLHTGSIHWYLAMLPAALVVLLLVARWLR